MDKKELLERADLTAAEKLIADIIPWEHPIIGQPFCERQIGDVALDRFVQAFLEDELGIEAEVLVLRYGFRDGKTRTLKEIGQELGVTGERIRQREAKALRKLRHPSYLRRLRYFLKNRFNKLPVEEKEEIRERAKRYISGSERTKKEIQEWAEEEKKRKEETTALLNIFRLTTFSRSRLQRITDTGITLTDLKTLSEEKVIKKLDMDPYRLNTKTEQCLREMWKIVNPKQKASL